MDSNLKSIAIIPARGGSTRIPRKNLLELGGRALIDWTISAAIDSNLFDFVLVSTESEEIAEVAVRAGAEVPFLRSGNFDEFATSSEATITALHQAESHWSTNFEIVAQLLPTCPLRGVGEIRSILSAFSASNYSSSIISASEISFQPIWWSARVADDHVPTYLFPDKLQCRSQDLDKALVPNGAVWISHRDALLKHNTFYSDGHKFHEISWIAGLDIDTYTEFKIVEALFPLA